MPLFIEPLKGFEWECGYGAIAAAAKFYNCDYQLSYKDLWKFDYLESEDEKASLGSRIETSMIDIIEALYTYCNFKVIDIPMNDVTEVISKIKEELRAGRPPKLRMDLFWCPWHTEAYQCLHLPHSFLVVDSDEQNNTLKFIDHSPMLSDAMLNIADLPEHSDYTVTVFEMADKKPGQFNWRLLIGEGCNRILGKSNSKSIFELQRKFAAKLLNLTSLDAEYGEAEKLMQTDLYKNLIRISQHRILYGEFLQFVAERYEMPELSDSIENINLASDKWDKIKSMFVKASMFDNGPTVLNRIHKKIMELSDFEEKTAYDLLAAVGPNTAGM
jgi:hypothetical protein